MAVIRGKVRLSGHSQHRRQRVRMPLGGCVPLEHRPFSCGGDADIWTSLSASTIDPPSLSALITARQHAKVYQDPKLLFVGTSKVASKLADVFYRELFCEGNSVTLASSAEALHSSLMKLKDSGVPVEDLITFIHIGI
jgi:hypothetical protein